MGYENNAALAALDKDKYKMIDGSTSSNSYLAFAINGNSVIGIKPYGMVPGSAHGVKNTVFVIARLRSTKVTPKFEEDAKVVKLSAPFDDWTKPWPNVHFDKPMDSYASTQVGVFLRGSVSGDPEMMKSFFDNFEGRKFSDKFADYLIDLVGVEQTILTKREISTWLDAYYSPVIEQIKSQHQIATEFKENVEKNIGVFGMQQQLLTHLAEKHKIVQSSAEDHEDPDAVGDGIEGVGDDDHENPDEDHAED